MTMTIRLANLRTSCARRAMTCRVLVMSVCLSGFAASVSAATYTSANFIVSASSSSVAQRVAEVAEESRIRFANEWLMTPPASGKVLCRIRVKEQSTGGHGWISFESYRGGIENLEIIVTGQLDRILEYVLPHEVAHAVLAASLDRPLPRWADEGVALLSESESQQERQRKKASQLAATDALLPLTKILRIAHYPDDQQSMVAFYLSSFSLTEYLVARGGKQRLLNFVHDGDREGWEVSMRRHYDADPDELEAAWKSWSPSDATSHLLAGVDEAHSAAATPVRGPNSSNAK